MLALRSIPHQVDPNRGQVQVPPLAVPCDWSLARCLHPWGHLFLTFEGEQGIGFGKVWVGTQSPSSVELSEPWGLGIPISGDSRLIGEKGEEYPKE